MGAGKVGNAIVGKANGVAVWDGTASVHVGRTSELIGVGVDSIVCTTGVQADNASNMLIHRR
jgi:intracellular sulfur oxidation DsrE/DsrF family protein